MLFTIGAALFLLLYAFGCLYLHMKFLTFIRNSERFIRLQEEMYNDLIEIVRLDKELCSIMEELNDYN